MFNVQRSMFNVQRSMFNVQRSMFNVQCSTFNVQRLNVQLQYEANALREFSVNLQVSIHLTSHLLTDGQSQAIALSEVSDFEERLKDVLTLLFWNRRACIGYQELQGVSTTLLELQPDGTLLRSVLSGIVQQVQQQIR